jgi:hypothetical protein
MLNEEVYDTFLAIAIDDPQKRELNRKVWVALAAFNGELLKPLNNPEDASERLTKSIEVEDGAVAYVESFSAAVGEELCTLYMHQSMRHLPAMVLRFPVNIADLSQQYVEHALKQGKSDMVNFTNKRLRDEGQELGRNYQVMANDRERAKLKRTVPMPLTRNEKRQLGDGTKVAEQTVARARRRGQLISRSGLQLGKRLAKSTPALQVIVHRIQAQRALTANPGSPSRLSPSAMAASDNGDPGTGVPPIAEEEGIAPAGRGRGAGAGRGKGPAAGRKAAAGRGRGRGSRGRVRTRPATARDY